MALVHKINIKCQQDADKLSGIVSNAHIDIQHDRCVFFHVTEFKNCIFFSYDFEAPNCSMINGDVFVPNISGVL